MHCWKGRMTAILVPTARQRWWLPLATSTTRQLMGENILIAAPNWRERRRLQCRSAKSWSDIYVRCRAGAEAR